MPDETSIAEPVKKLKKAATEPSAPAVEAAPVPAYRQWSIVIDGREVRTVQTDHPGSEAEALAKYEHGYGKPEGEARATPLE